MSIWDTHTGVSSLDAKPRAATTEELCAYMRELGTRAGLDVSGTFTLHGNGTTFGKMTAEAVREGGKEVTPRQYAPGSFSIALPGYGQKQTVTVELLDEAGNVVRSMPLPVNGKGALPFDKADAVKWTDLAPVKRRKPAASASKPAAAPVKARRKAKRSPAHVRAIHAYLARRADRVRFAAREAALIRGIEFERHCAACAENALAAARVQVQEANARADAATFSRVDPEALAVAERVALAVEARRRAAQGLLIGLRRNVQLAREAAERAAHTAAALDARAARAEAERDEARAFVNIVGEALAAAGDAGEAVEAHALSLAARRAA